MADESPIVGFPDGSDSIHPWTPDPSPAPDWFRAALAVPAETHEISVEDATITFRTWGRPDKPGLVFVHGGGAHNYWWTHIAALFAHDHRVAALDLTGHGDSDHRSTYTVEQWTREVMAVADASQFAGPPVVIGHSMGGMVAIVTAAIAGEGRLAGAIVGDSPVAEPDPEVASARLGVFRQTKVYPSLEAALPHFRTVPTQEQYLDYVIDHVARHSLRETDQGWRWKFDPNLFSAFAGDPRGIALPYLGDIHCRLALLSFEKGLLTDDISQFMYDRMGRVTPVIRVPETGHHAMLDQPLLLVTAIRSLLADWDHSTPILRGRSPGAVVTTPLGIAIAPEPARNTWLADAVHAGGGKVVDVDQARGLVWAIPKHPERLAELLASNPGIEWVQLPFAGIETFVPLTNDGRRWTCAKGTFAAPVAELALSLLLAGLRGVGVYPRRTTWEKSDANALGHNLLGARVTILGGGGIATSLLKLLGGFDVTSTVIRRQSTDEVPGADRTLGMDALHDALGDADAVVLALAATPQTRGIIDAAALEAMPGDAWLVNVARGTHVVTDDLVDALERGAIGGAALDVTDPEPLPDGHPLWSLPNAIVTPHVGNTPAMAVPLLSARVTENVRHFIAGQPLVGSVDPDLGY